MARARNIKPGLFKNEDLAECSIWARYIFPGLWMLADREGRLEDRPKRIKGELLPFDAQDIEPLLQELQAHGFLVRYRNSDGSFIQISKFSTHQTPHYSEKQSAIKPPDSRKAAPFNQPDSGKDGPTKPVDAASNPESSGKDPALRGGRNPLIPDSLNPDSLIPDSLIPESGKSAAGLIPLAREAESRCAALTSLCESSRVRIDAKTRMHLRQWANEDLTEQRLADAIAIAREQKPHPEMIPIGFIVSIMPDVISGRRSAGSAGYDQAAVIARTIASINAKEAQDAAR